MTGSLSPQAACHRQGSSEFSALNAKQNPTSFTNASAWRLVVTARDGMRRWTLSRHFSISSSVYLIFMIFSGVRTGRRHGAGGAGLSCAYHFADGGEALPE